MHHVVRWKQRSRSVVVPPDEPSGARGQEGTKAQGARKLWELGDVTRLFLLFSLLRRGSRVLLYRYRSCCCAEPLKSLSFKMAARPGEENVATL